MIGRPARQRSQRGGGTAPRGLYRRAAVAGVCWVAAGCQFPAYFVASTDDERGGTNSSGGESPATGAQASGGAPSGGSSTAGASALGGASATAGAGAPGGESLGGAVASGGSDPMHDAAGQGGASNDPSPLFFDDFESGAASQWLTISGSSWSVVNDLSRASKVYRHSPVFADFYAAAATHGSSADQIIEAKVKVLSFGGPSPADVAAVYGRFGNVDNYFAAVLRPDGRAALRASVGGAPLTTIKTSAQLGVTTDVWYQLRFELIGSSLRLFVDGNLRIETVDARLTQGTVAIGGANTAAMFDDVRVTSP